MRPYTLAAASLVLTVSAGAVASGIVQVPESVTSVVGQIPVVGDTATHYEEQNKAGLDAFENLYGKPPTDAIKTLMSTVGRVFNPTAGG